MVYVQWPSMHQKMSESCKICSPIKLCYCINWNVIGKKMQDNNIYRLRDQTITSGHEWFTWLKGISLKLHKIRHPISEMILWNTDLWSHPTISSSFSSHDSRLSLYSSNTKISNLNNLKAKRFGYFRQIKFCK